MSEDENKSLEEMKRELLFYKSQTKSLRDKNRDLRNALLLAESKGSPIEAEATTEESLSDIRKIIADSKKQISEKLSQFKESISGPEGASTSSSQAKAPTTPKYSLSLEETQKDDMSIGKTESIANLQKLSGNEEALSKQVDYLKTELERLENFLEQSEMVNTRLRELLSDHSIDVSEISKAIKEVSKTAVSPKAISLEKVQAPIQQRAIPTSVFKEDPFAFKTDLKALDPSVVKLFNAFRGRLDTNLSNEDICIEILNFREQLMDLIPHSRVFYEMQVEYRKWKKGASSIKELKNTLKEWEKTIASI